MQFIGTLPKYGSDEVLEKRPDGQWEMARLGLDDAPVPRKTVLVLRSPLFVPRRRPEIDPRSEDAGDMTARSFYSWRRHPKAPWKRVKEGELSHPRLPIEDGFVCDWGYWLCRVTMEEYLALPDALKATVIKDNHRKIVPEIKVSKKKQPKPKPASRP